MLVAVGLPAPRSEGQVQGFPEGQEVDDAVDNVSWDVFFLHLEGVALDDVVGAQLGLLAAGFGAEHRLHDDVSVIGDGHLIREVRGILHHLQSVGKL